MLENQTQRVQSLEHEVADASLSQEFSRGKIANTNMEIKSRYRQLQKKSKSQAEEIKQLKETIKQISEEVGPRVK